MAEVLLTVAPKFTQLVTTLLSTNLFYKIFSILVKKLKMKIVPTTATPPTTTTSTVPWSGLLRRQKDLNLLINLCEEHHGLGRSHRGVSESLAVGVLADGRKHRAVLESSEKNINGPLHMCKGFITVS